MRHDDEDAFEALAKSTMQVVAAGAYLRSDGSRVVLRAAIDAAVRDTRLFKESELHALIAARPAAPPPSADAPPASPQRTDCWDLRSGACAQRLLAEGARHVALLNYANGVTPGGGFLNGSRAQEESLCRCSALYACLAQQTPQVRFYYDDNSAAETALVRGHVLCSPAVPFFRSEDYALIDRPFHATVITAAAPDLGWLFATTEEGLEPRTRFDEVPGVFLRRTLYVLEAARQVGADAVVLGPWGCGAFGNDPDVVADAFQQALRRYDDVFERVVFSTWGPEQNRAAFERRFAATNVRVVPRHGVR